MRGRVGTAPELCSGPANCHGTCSDNMDQKGDTVVKTERRTASRPPAPVVCRGRLHRSCDRRTWGRKGGVGVGFVKDGLGEGGCSRWARSAGSSRVVVSATVKQLLRRVSMCVSVFLTI